MGKNLKHVANYYDVYKLQSKDIKGIDLWVVILERINESNIKVYELFVKMENMLEGEFGFTEFENDAIGELEDYAKDYDNNKEIIKEIRDHILTHHSKDKNLLKFFDFIINQ